MTSQQACHISRFTSLPALKTHPPPTFSASVCQTTQFSASTSTATTFRAPTHSPPPNSLATATPKKQKLPLSLLSLCPSCALLHSSRACLDLCWKTLRASVHHQGSRREILTEALHTSLQQLFISSRCVLQRCTCLNTAQGFGFAHLFFCTEGNEGSERKNE